MTYAAPAMVAIANGFTMLLFYYGGHGLRGDSVVKSSGLPFLRYARDGCIAVLIAAPLVWLSGERSCRMTARLWLYFTVLSGKPGPFAPLSPAVTVIRARNPVRLVIRRRI